MPSKVFRYTGRAQRWPVPKDVDYVTVVVEGAGSGSTPGGRVTGRIKVNDRQSLVVQVGQAGKLNDGTKGGATAYGGGGRGGNGRGKVGGDGGGGGSFVRVNSSTGAIRAAAGGAGGSSGDGGRGGRGGHATGEHGWPGNAALNDGIGEVIEVPGGFDYTGISNATGGTQVQGGGPGRSGLDSRHDGTAGSTSGFEFGGYGGNGYRADTWGGGGGGGGYRSGGGGVAAIEGEHPGGGGAGGSNYVEGMIGATSTVGGGGAGNGMVRISWVNPAPANQPPRPPTDVKINDKAAVTAHVTRSTGTVKISALLSDPDRREDDDGTPIPDSGDKLRLVAVYSPTSDFSRQVRRANTDLIGQQRAKSKNKKARSGRATITLRGLSQNQRYYVRLYTRDHKGLVSTNYKTVDFWTNRRPDPPTLQAPSENASVNELQNVVFTWAHNDPDGGAQSNYNIQWRRAATPTHPASGWVEASNRTSFESHTRNADLFAVNNFTEWRVRTRDAQGQWSGWSQVRSLFVTGQATAPALLSPVRNEAADVSKPLTFRWQFRDPQEGDVQAKADIRWRVIGEAGARVLPEPTEWVTRLGTSAMPGGTQAWTIPAHTLMPGLNYEWQARTTDSLVGATSQWSDSSFFWSVVTPGVAVAKERTPLLTYPDGSLGCGNNRVFVYDRGGKNLRGEIKPLQNLTYGRQRDDIANCLLDTNGWDADGGQLLASLHSWMHEIVIYRDGRRVFEGPITRITYRQDLVEVEAKDVIGYLYRRIMRQGYNDAYRVVNGEQIGQVSVVERATRIIMNALCYDDPNLLPYLTALNYPNDAKQSRVAADYSRTSWEEFDDMAANSGLDYTAIGRRIILNDTHRPLGRIPEMRDLHFDNPPVVTEYGMQLATDFGVTNNNGVFGLATKNIGPYGHIEQLASAYGEDEGVVADATLTGAARDNLERTLREQAQRNIDGRYPTPVIVRIPDNSALSADAPVTFDQLVPGVWIPLRSTATLRDVAQWQKLDQVTVTQTPDAGERITVTMSPAPNGGADPDAEGAIDDGGAV